MNLAKMLNKKVSESSILNKIKFSYNNIFLHYGTLDTDDPTLAQLLYKDTYDSLGNYISEHREGIKHYLSLRYNHDLF